MNSENLPPDAVAGQNGADGQKNGDGDGYHSQRVVSRLICTCDEQQTAGVHVKLML